MSTDTLPSLHANVRERTGTRYAARARAEGNLPAVIYGHKQDPVHISVDQMEIIALLRNNAHLIQVEVAGKTEPCLVKDIQWDHLGSKIIHIDLARVNLGEEVDVEIEIELVGDAAGLKEAGAILEQNTSTIQIKCRADAIPEKLTHDVSEMTVGDSLLVSGLTMPAGVTVSSDADLLIAHMSVAKAVVEDEDDADAEGGDQPEVIGDTPEGDEKAKDDDK